MSASWIYGPLISTDDFAGHAALLGRTYGMAPRGAGRLEGADAEALLGEGFAADLQVLGTPGVTAGAVLCRFDGPPAPPVRDEESRLFRDAFRVIDFYAPDFAAALEHSAAAGFPMHTKEASYELAEGSFREAHVEAPDNVMTAFLSGPADFFTEFAQVRDRIASEPVSISLPLSDAATTTAFYRDVFGWGVVYEYDFVDASFSAMLGIDGEDAEPIKVCSQALGPSRDRTYVNIVDYGLPADRAGSLLGASVPPRRGLLGLVVLTDDLDGVVARAGADARLGEVVDVDLPGFGSSRATTLRAPFGAPHVVAQPRDAEAILRADA
ncbi:hypothetical protein KG112_01105 [Nocardioides sp. zg-ZUI104]|uniref:VOC family protein n=1 Tax=Nocardioides faecalis TaxID=2803858 RepID=UPI001BCD995E|nr:hypothetical protein [Nocardioides faecalis]MBS4751401.1 hypothetical protein [Nocardioides faecalis]